MTTVRLVLRLLGRTKEARDRSVPPETTLSDLRRAVEGEADPGLRKLLIHPDSGQSIYLCLVNGRTAEDGTVLRDGDEVTFLGLVPGG